MKLHSRREVFRSLALLAGGALLPAAQQTPRKKPNVVIFLVDDMGYSDLGCYGAKDIRTPNIDRLAQEGVRLTDNYSNGPVCTPTRAALMTGRYQQRVGLEWALTPKDQDKGLPASETSLARMLKDNGYQTAMFGKWHLGYEPEYGPNAHGFDEFFGILSGNVDHYSHKVVGGEPDLWEKTDPVVKPGYMTELITERAVKYIEGRGETPFFLYVPYNAVHWPFQAPGRPQDVRNRETWFNGTRADYVEMVESIDQSVGKILATLERKKAEDNTLVIFTNDNGGERLSDNLPMFHHKATLWEGGIRVPAILRWPGNLPAGEVSAQPTMTMDFTASVLAATGAAPPSGRKLDGMDILPILRGEKPEAERTFFWRIDRQDRKQKAVREGQWKYIRDGNIELLFDLKSDPSERQDLAYRHPEKMRELRALVQNWEAELAKNPPPFEVK